ncbi:DMT family transporter [Pelagerythrobacter rhizovicinus]|uniref:DMT family transporter n=1 Tax=Pelagerythrobacter rhizovicinus TaxID=2268576 RepID=A0A4Q2KGG0_9SPHN|nr:DMT family transporter [Pelagerythrobacter rhizovicinus]RXZ64154.1 DMT family transporter [Pelagerythrobacter rhizovicinus]
MAITTEPEGEKNYQAGAWHFAALVGGNLALALGPWFVRMSDTGPVAAGFWRMVIALPVIALLAWRARTPEPLDRRLALLVGAAGLFFALDLASWHIGIERTRLGNATLFGNSGSVILMIWGLVALRRRPRGLEWLALAAALGGAAILMGRSLEVSTATLAGDLLCLLAGIFYAFYLIPAHRARSGLGQWTVLLLVGLASAPILLAMALAMGEPVWPGTAGWAPVVGLALSSQIVGQGLLVFSLRHFPPLVIGVALLTQPAIAAAVGWLAFGEVLGLPDMAGMTLVACALLLAKLAEPRAARAVFAER